MVCSFILFCWWVERTRSYSISKWKKMPFRIYTRICRKNSLRGANHIDAYFHVMTESADCVHMKLVREADVLACMLKQWLRCDFVFFCCSLYWHQMGSNWRCVVVVFAFMFAVRCSYALLSIQIEINMMPISDGLTFAHIFETKFDNSRFCLHYGISHHLKFWSTRSGRIPLDILHFCSKSFTGSIYRIRYS